MTPSLADYQDVVGPGVIDELRAVAGHVAGKRFQHVNSTPVGGGVAEILTRLVPLSHLPRIDLSFVSVVISKSAPGSHRFRIFASENAPS